MTKSRNAIRRAITFGGCCLLAACSNTPTNLSAGKHGSELSGSLVFPSKIALAALGNNPSESDRSNIARREETWHKDVVEACSKMPQCGQNQTEQQVERRLSCLFNRPSGHSDLSLNGPPRKELIGLAVQKAAKETGPITPEQTEKAAGCRSDTDQDLGANSWGYWALYSICSPCHDKRIVARPICQERPLFVHVTN